MAKAPTNKELAESILNGIEFEGKTLFEWVKLISKENFVEVVLCKDCKHYNTSCCADGFGWCEKHNRGEMDEHYFSYGERRCEE